MPCTAGDLSYDGDHDDEFYRGIMHVNIQMGAGNTAAAGIHWAMSQVGIFDSALGCDKPAGSAARCTI